MKTILCLLGAYIHACMQQQRGDQRQQKQLQRGKAGQRQRLRRKSCWVREWLSEDRRQKLGHYSTFITRELRTEDVNTFQNYLRMPPGLFDEILERVKPTI